MTWYKTGTVSVTNGSPNVTLASGNAQLNIFPDDGFVGPDGRTYAILQVNSATQFVLSQNYKGATASGQDYIIIPTADHIQLRDMLVGVNDLIDRFETISLEAGAGRFQSGTALEPGVRGVSQSATGLVWNGDGTLGISVNGAIVATFNASGLNGAITGATFTAAHQILISTAANTATVAAIGTNSVIGRAASGNIKGLTAAEGRTALGLGSMATINSPAPIANGGTGATTAAAARTALGAVGLTDFADVINTNGYYAAPSPVGKMYFQWGYGTSVAGTGALITLPIAFPNAAVLHLNAVTIGGPNSWIISVQAVSASQFRVFATNLAGTVVGGITFFWMAMGV